MMGVTETFYDMFMIPFESLRLSKRRNSLISIAHGNVLEVGVGTGVNFKHYHYNHINKLDLLDISLTDKVKTYIFPKQLNITLNELSVEHLPFNDDTYDFVVFTLVFCSVPNPLAGLSEIRRVLKPGGKIIFMEHVLPHSHSLKKIFHRLTPTWENLAHGCHLTRETLKDIRSIGFTIDNSERFFKGVFISGIATNTK
jgi:ubiquinone/menaquinone biosynthesis C-methylase UbiE